MSKKDYALIAAAIDRAGPTATPERVAMSIAVTLKADNPRFIYAKFLEACGYPVE